MTEPNPDKRVNKHEAAKILSRSPAIVVAWAAAGKLAAAGAARINGGRWSFNLARLQAFAAARQEEESQRSPGPPLSVPRAEPKAREAETAAAPRRKAARRGPSAATVASWERRSRAKEAEDLRIFQEWERDRQARKAERETRRRKETEARQQARAEQCSSNCSASTRRKVATSAIGAASAQPCAPAASRGWR
jgi:hypothetical protein